LISKNAEGGVKEFAHDGAADGEIVEFSVLEFGDPRLRNFAVTPGDGRRWIKGFTWEAIADFAQNGFVVGGTGRAAFLGRKASLGGQLTCGMELFAGQLAE
jgi:hypothetical protein